MDWQQITTLLIVTLTAWLLVRHWRGQRSRLGDCGTCSACPTEHREFSDVNTVHTSLPGGSERGSFAHRLKIEPKMSIFE